MNDSQPNTMLKQSLKRTWFSRLLPHTQKTVLQKVLLIIGGAGFFVGSVMGDPKYLSTVFQQRIDMASLKLLFQNGYNVFNNAESKADLITDYALKLIDKFFPQSDAPLLPDTKDLHYSPNFPTLVVDLNHVILKMEYDRRFGWRVLKRPGADAFFKELVYHYEIVLWSDDNFPVAQDVCTQWQLPVIGVLHRDQCKKRNGHYIKDLSRLGRPLDRVLILDHDPFAFSLQPENGILISEFNGDPYDADLKSLINFLKMAALSPRQDIRDVVKDYGGGDANLVKRWTIRQEETKRKTAKCRQLGSKLFGQPISPKPG